jgi:type VI protein secretion system component Hcp
MKGSSLDEDSKGKMDFEALEMKIGREEFQEHMKQKCNKHDLQMAYR